MILKKWMHRGFASIGSVILLIVFCSSALATPKYVRPIVGTYGVHDGASYETAWDGFGDINWSGEMGVKAGDTLYVCGTFISEYFNVQASGIEGAPITIRGDCPGDKGKIVAEGLTKGIRIASQSYVTIKNIEITGSIGQGIGTMEVNSNLVLDGVDSHHNKKGGYLEATNIEVVNSKFHDNEESGLGISQSDNAHIYNSQFYSNGTSGPNNHDGLLVGNGSENFIIEKCIAYDNRSEQGSGIDVSGSLVGHTSGTIRYNLSHDNEGKGFSASGEDAAFVHHHNIAYKNNINYIAYQDVEVYIYNNTFGDVKEGSTTSSVKFGYNDIDGPNNVIAEFKNNIVSGNFPHAIEKRVSSVNLTSNNNCLYGGTISFAKLNSTILTTWDEWKAVGFDTIGSINQDPLFVDLTTPDFHLTADSACIDGGTELPSELDLSGGDYDSTPVPQGTSLDMGAYEFDCTDSDLDGYATDGGLCGEADCNDYDATAYPGSEEVCDGIDNNCNGIVDDSVYIFSGFQQPIHEDGSSIFKMGRTIPVKLRINDCGSQSISTATVTIAVINITDQILGTIEQLEVEASGNANTDNIFRYDNTNEQYIYNLNTQGYTKGTYKIIVQINNGKSYSVKFSLKDK